MRVFIRHGSKPFRDWAGTMLVELEVINITGCVPLQNGLRFQAYIKTQQILQHFWVKYNCAKTADFTQYFTDINQKKRVEKPKQNEGISSEVHNHCNMQKELMSRGF